MTTVMLLGAIKRFLDSLFAHESIVPTTRLGFLPQKAPGPGGAQESDFPFIIIRPAVGEDALNGQTVKVKLLFGHKCQDDDGFIELFNIMETTRIAFLYQRFLEQRFIFNGDYKWTFFDEQPYPEWIGEAVLSFTLPTVLEEGLDI
ncbi:hypothetical protein [Paenibacillus xanthanilyticus]|uniref:Uncharacterized protein n=1 Tax=Paenibacillus xanthanilyticus TaxID=1783531 RepID=A0ABV8KA85_9BACL